MLGAHNYVRNMFSIQSITLVSLFVTRWDCSRVIRFSTLGDFLFLNRATFVTPRQKRASSSSSGLTSPSSFDWKNSRIRRRTEQSENAELCRCFSCWDWHCFVQNAPLHSEQRWLTASSWLARLRKHSAQIGPFVSVSWGQTTTGNSERMSSCAPRSLWETRALPAPRRFRIRKDGSSASCTLDLGAISINQSHVSVKNYWHIEVSEQLIWMDQYIFLEIFAFTFSLFFRLEFDY